MTAARSSPCYFDDVRPSTPWEVVLYVDHRADEAQTAALADIFWRTKEYTPARQSSFSACSAGE